MARRLVNKWDPLLAAHVIHAIAMQVVKVKDLPNEAPAKDEVR